MPIELKHLRYAEAAERYGSFRKAADSLFVKQSNLSRRIRDLENELGVVLFERTSGGVRPTLAGREFVGSVRRVIDELGAIVDSAKAVGRGDAGHLTVGFYTSISAGNLRATLIEYARRVPQIEINTFEGSRSRLLDCVASGSIDIAIVMGEKASATNCSMALWSERIIIALPENHQLSTAELVYWTDLKRERFVLSERDPGPEIQELLIAKLASPGDAPNITRHDVSLESIKGLVSAGYGVSLMCEASMGTNYAGVTYREVRDGNSVTRISYCAYWRENNDNPALRNFIRLLEERCPPIANGNLLHGASS